MGLEKNLVSARVHASMEQSLRAGNEGTGRRKW